MLTPRGILGVLLATAFLATALWYALGTFTITEDVVGRPAAVEAGTAPDESRRVTIECRSDGGTSFLGATGEPMSFDSSWSPESPNPLCDEARRGRYPLAIGLAVIGTIIGVVVAASASRATTDD